MGGYGSGLGDFHAGALFRCKILHGISMSRTKDMWMDEIERIEDDFAANKLSRDEAIYAMKRLGLDVLEASNLLDSVIS